MMNYDVIVNLVQCLMYSLPSAMTPSCYFQGATIVDQSVTIALALDYKLPPNAAAIPAVWFFIQSSDCLFYFVILFRITQLFNLVRQQRTKMQVVLHLLCRRRRMLSVACWPRALPWEKMHLTKQSPSMRSISSLPLLQPKLLLWIRRLALVRKSP